MKITTTCTILLTLLLNCCIGFAQSSFTIQGTVTFANIGAPLPGIDINWASDDGAFEGVATSDEQGKYSTTIDIPAGDYHTFQVSAIDFCTGEIYTVGVDNAQAVAIADFNLCDFLPPPPNPDCEAFFDVQSNNPDNPLEITFTDLSFSSAPILGWFWDFGDGNASDQPNPVHTYTEEGNYQVSLSIETDSCFAINELNIWVGNNGGCMCDFDFDPVCVISPAGELLSFPNDCWAECAGYTPNDYVDCENDCNCTTEWDPVCVNGTAGQILFPNACFAQCEGFGPDDLVDCEDDCICTDEWDPVCVIGPNGDVLHFGNPCEARCEGYTVDDFVNCEDDCNCDDTWDPVCVQLGSGQLQFPNACLAECAGFTADDFVDCEDDCICTDEWDPVCVVDDAGNTILFGNACEAVCQGYTADDFVDCQNDCQCDDIWDPVCVFTASGTELFPNPCYAECAGYGPDDFVDCEDDCNCTFEWDPVCVETATGQVQFPNACVAECEGFSPDDFVDCEDDCICTDEWDPVCVVGPSGVILTFGNPCEAACEGFGPDDFVDCNNCVCDDIWDPVCVIDSTTGAQLLFGNECFAECAGYGPDDFIDCFDNCQCDDIWDPVCVIDDAGNTLLFPNPCYAECEGYGPDDFVDCDGQDCWVDIIYFQTSSDELTVNFEAFVSTDNVSEYLWDFGDGNTSTEANPVHTYASEGVYEVSLTVVTEDGCTAVAHTHICVGGDGTVDPPDCQAFFFFTQSDNDLMTFEFINFSFGNNLTYEWDFGDGNTSDEQNPVHTYAEDGAYEVTLTVSNASCSSSFTMIVATSPGIVYGDECKALFLPLLNEDELEVTFINLSSPDAISYLWNFGDGTISDENSPVHQYAVSGSYDINLTITTADGCANTFEMNVNLEDGNFTGSPQFFVVNTKDPGFLHTVKLAPNPATTEVQLSFTSKLAIEADVQIISLAGQLVSSQHTSISNGENVLEVAVDELEGGLYFLRIVSEEYSKSFKFVKQ